MAIRAVVHPSALEVLETTVGPRDAPNAGDALWNAAVAAGVVEPGAVASEEASKVDNNNQAEVSVAAALVEWAAGGDLEAPLPRAVLRAALDTAAVRRFQSVVLSGLLVKASAAGSTDLAGVAPMVHDAVNTIASTLSRVPPEIVAILHAAASAAERGSCRLPRHGGGSSAAEIVEARCGLPAAIAGFVELVLVAPLIDGERAWERLVGCSLPADSGSAAGGTTFGATAVALALAVRLLRAIPIVLDGERRLEAVLSPLEPLIRDWAALLAPGIEACLYAVSPRLCVRILAAVPMPSPPSLRAAHDCFTQLGATLVQLGNSQHQAVVDALTDAGNACLALADRLALDRSPVSDSGVFSGPAAGTVEAAAEATAEEAAVVTQAAVLQLGAAVEGVALILAEGAGRSRPNEDDRRRAVRSLQVVFQAAAQAERGKSRRTPGDADGAGVAKKDMLSTYLMSQLGRQGDQLVSLTAVRAQRLASLPTSRFCLRAAVPDATTTRHNRKQRARSMSGGEPGSHSGGSDDACNDSVISLGPPIGDSGSEGEATSLETSFTLMDDSRIMADFTSSSSSSSSSSCSDDEDAMLDITVDSLGAANDGKERGRWEVIHDAPGGIKEQVLQQISGGDTTTATTSPPALLSNRGYRHLLQELEGDGLLARADTDTTAAAMVRHQLRAIIELTEACTAGSGNTTKRTPADVVTALQILAAAMRRTALALRINPGVSGRVRLVEEASHLMNGRAFERVSLPSSASNARLDVFVDAYCRGRQAGSRLSDSLGSVGSIADDVYLPDLDDLRVNGGSGGSGKAGGSGDGDADGGGDGRRRRVSSRVQTVSDAGVELFAFVGGGYKIKGATFEALIEYLLRSVRKADESFDAEFFRVVPLCLSTSAVLDALEARFDLVPDVILGKLQTWIETRWEYDFARRDTESLELILSFARRLGGRDPTLDAPLEAINETVRRLRAVPALEPAPASVLPRALTSFSIVQLPPVEVARQICLLNAEAFGRINIHAELLDCAWTRKATARTTSPNVLRMIDIFNRLSKWCTTEVLASDDERERAQLVRYFIRLATELKDLQDFSGTFAISSGIITTAVKRLKRTWARVPKEDTAAFKKLQFLMRHIGNYASYRQVIAEAEKPVVPHVGVHLTDIVYSYEGQPDFLDAAPRPRFDSAGDDSGGSGADGSGGAVINVAKWSAVGICFDTLASFQNSDYNLRKVPALRSFLAMVDGSEPKTNFARSLAVEPPTHKSPRRQAIKRSKTAGI